MILDVFPGLQNIPGCIHTVCLTEAHFIMPYKVCHVHHRGACSSANPLHLLLTITCHFTEVICFQDLTRLHFHRGIHSPDALPFEESTQQVSVSSVRESNTCLVFRELGS